MVPEQPPAGTGRTPRSHSTTRGTVGARGASRLGRTTGGVSPSTSALREAPGRAQRRIPTRRALQEQHLTSSSQKCQGTSPSVPALTQNVQTPGGARAGPRPHREEPARMWSQPAWCRPGPGCGVELPSPGLLTPSLSAVPNRTPTRTQSPFCDVCSGSLSTLPCLAAFAPAGFRRGRGKRSGLLSPRWLARPLACPTLWSGSAHGHRGRWTVLVARPPSQAVRS